MTSQRMTVCLADIERFNVVTRHMPLEDLVEFIQGFYEFVGDVLLSHGGRLVKYIGDAVLMAFDQDKEEIAVRAMWTLREGYRDYAGAAGGDTAISDLRIGIATGDVAAGQMGHPQILAYNVIGSPVTLAFALAKLGGIAIDAATEEAIQDRVTVAPADWRGDTRSYRVTGFR